LDGRGGAPGAANATAESSEPPDAPGGNPLLAEWNTPFGVPNSLYRSKPNTWTQTNISTYISHVVNSGRTDEIRILKIWRQLHGLTFPSFFLELAVINALLYTRRGNRPHL
jgi:hypothetical protein